MDLATYYFSVVAEHWPIWLVTVVLIVAAVIDGFELRVPNWITFPFILSGWGYSFGAYGWEGLLWSLGGTLLGMSILMLFYAIGGMGAGDVKLMGGVGRSEERRVGKECRSRWRSARTVRSGASTSR